MLEMTALLIVAVILAIIYRIRIEKMLPPVIMGGAILVYLIAITGASLTIACNVMVFLPVVIAVIILVFRSKSRISSVKPSLKEYVLTPQFIICAITLIVSFVLFSAHKVMHWDDFSYWGIYAKNILTIDRLPKGIENCSIQYKDYPPIMQIVEYIFMHRRSTFNEADMFRINTCFMYVLMLPFLSHIEKREVSKISRVCMIILYVTFPHLISTQFYYKLGVDYLIAILLGYAIYAITDDKEGGEVFSLIRVILTSSFLALIKTSGGLMCVFIAIFYIAHKWSERDGMPNKIKYAINNLVKSFLIPFAFYLSWKLFGRLTDNHGYLSDRLGSSLTDLKIQFPDYTGEVLINYLKHFIAAPINRAAYGLSALLIALLIVIIYLVRIDREKELSLMMAIGLVIFCIAHIYMYLFVFDDWEARDLLEYDRYIGQYLGGIFFYYIYDIVSDWELNGCRLKLKFNPSLIVAILFVALFPYTQAAELLIPVNFENMYNASFAQIADNALTEYEEVEIKLNELDMKCDEEHRLALIGDAWSDEIQSLIFDMVPQPVTAVCNTPAIEEGNFVNFTRSLLERNNISYIYVTENGRDGYPGNWETETSEITTDGLPLETGCFYKTVTSDGERRLQFIR